MQILVQYAFDFIKMPISCAGYRIQIQLPVYFNQDGLDLPVFLIISHWHHGSGIRPIQTNRKSPGCEEFQCEILECLRCMKWIGANIDIGTWHFFVQVSLKRNIRERMAIYHQGMTELI